MLKELGEALKRLVAGVLPPTAQIRAGIERSRMQVRALLMAGLLGALVLAGCGRGAASLEHAARTKAFDSAPPAIKERWGMVVSDLHGNGFNVKAQIALWDLRQERALTSEQQSVVEETLKTLAGRMYDAAGRGDPAALNALRDVRERRADDK